MPITDDWPILKEGVWLYAGSVPVAVRILLSAETWGTGDYEDEEVIREDRKVECYFLAYEMAAAPGKFCNLIPNIMSFEEAVLAAEYRFPGIQWAPSKKE
jgi:hypothetical protein